MRIVRRDFVRALGASGACASLPPPLWKSAPQDLRARLAADPLRPLDAQGQRILWGWIPETRPQAEFSAAGWAGCMALPRVLSLGSSGDVLMHTVPEVHALRAKSFIRQGPRAALSHIALSALDVKIENLCGEILWSTASSRCNFILEDRSGPWWSVESLPRDLLRPESPSMESPPRCLGHPITIWNSTCSSTVQWPNCFATTCMHSPCASIAHQTDLCAFARTMALSAPSVRYRLGSCSLSLPIA